MAQNNATEKPSAEVKKTEVGETSEWGFYADVRVRISNPDGKDVVSLRTYKARPMHDDLVSDEDAVQESIAYWWPDDYPSQGDSPFADGGADWQPVAGLDDDDALLDECVESATYDPAAELDALTHRSESIRKKLESEA